MSDTRSTLKAKKQTGRKVRVAASRDKEPDRTESSREISHRVVYAGHTYEVSTRDKTEKQEKLLEEMTARIARILMDDERGSRSQSNELWAGFLPHLKARSGLEPSVKIQLSGLVKEAVLRTGSDGRLTLILTEKEGSAPSPSTIEAIVVGASAALDLSPYDVFDDALSQDAEALHEDIVQVGNDLAIVWARGHGKEQRRRPKASKASGQTKQKD